MPNPIFDSLIAPHLDRTEALLLLPDGSDMSGSEVMALAGGFQAALAAHGLKTGNRLMVQVEKSVANLALYLATLASGIVFIPLNTGYTPAEMDYLVRDAQPAAIIADPGRIESLSGLAASLSIPLLALDAKGGGAFGNAAERSRTRLVPAERSLDDLAAILFTSGSTGKPKGAMLTQGNLLSNALTLRELWGFSDTDRLLHALPIFHVHGLFVAINVALASKASMIWLDRFDPIEVIRLMPQATVMMGVPTFYVRLLGQPGLTREAVKSMRLFISGSAPLLPQTFEEFVARTGHTILERYGMTETGMNTSNPLIGERRIGSVGFPLPGVSLRIADQTTGEALAQDAVGVIEVKGPNVFAGYWNKAEQTASEHRADGFFVTGDLGRIDEDGYVHIVGRAKDLIISGGLNVYPIEIEERIDAVDGVAESAVFGVPHPDFGEAVVAAVVPKAATNLDPATIQAAIADDLARFKQPKAVLIVRELPRNTMGKVQKNLLRQAHAALFSGRVS